MLPEDETPSRRCAAEATTSLTQGVEACRALLDRIKARVPIWKREWGPDGAAWVGWVDARCSPDAHEHPHPHPHGTPETSGPRGASPPAQLQSIFSTYEAVLLPCPR